MTTHEFANCAYTQKVVKFGRMMTEAGWDVILYSGDENESPVTEHVPLFTREEMAAWFGTDDAAKLPTAAGTWDGRHVSAMNFNARALAAIAKRYEKRDLCLLTGGLSQKMIADVMNALDVWAIEWAVGYEGWFTDAVAFESQSWRHHCYGLNQIRDGRWNDVVIPNFFDVDDFELAETKEDYLLFIGRLVARKGPHVAAEIARELDMPLVVAGAGAKNHRDGKFIECEDGTRIEGDVAYVGVVNPKQRSGLMGSARAVLVPTTYIEPFGGVAVEAQFCGTPAVTTDWGAFTETVPPELRFRSLAEGVEAVSYAKMAKPDLVRRSAIERYSLEAVAPQFTRWFQQLANRWDQGWYQPAAPPSTLPAEEVAK